MEVHKKLVGRCSGKLISQFMFAAEGCLPGAKYRTGLQAITEPEDRSKRLWKK